MNLENLSKDVLIEEAIHFSIRDVLSLCLTSKHFNNTICKNQLFWGKKLLVDYPTRIPKGIFRNHKRLYFLLSRRSKIIEIDGRDYPELKKKYDIYEEDYYNAELLNEAIQNKPPKELLLRGDIVRPKWVSHYRNANKYIWNGEKLVLLDDDIDEYGSVPQEFAFPEFSPDHFIDSITHNYIVRFTPEKRDEIMNNFDVNTQTSFVTDKYNKYDMERKEKGSPLESLDVYKKPWVEWMEYDEWMRAGTKGKRFVFHA